MGSGAGLVPGCGCRADLNLPSDRERQPTTQAFNMVRGWGTFLKKGRIMGNGMGGYYRHLKALAKIGNP
jgi:hypothetical protein